MSEHSRVFSDGQLSEIVARRAKGETYEVIATAIHRQYGQETSAEAVRRAYNKYRHLFETKHAVGNIKVLKEIARVKRRASDVARESRTVLAALNERDDLIEQLRTMVAGMPKVKQPAVKPVAKDAAKTDMTVEALLSDVHVGKLTDTFNAEVCKQRLRLFTSVLLQEIERKRVHYNVERVILAMLGDMIENSIMHGKESATACEFENPQQICRAIELLWFEVLQPVAATGLPIDVIGITGNHDRQEEKPTFNNPGLNSHTWVIYQGLKMLADQHGYKNLTWTLPEGVYTALEVYGDYVLYEHGDRIRGGNDKKSFLAHMVKRSGQLGVLIKGLRVGHWHEHSCLDNGAVIVNGSVPGQDSYADVNGYISKPGQTITYYVRTKNRASSYYHSLLVQL